MAMTSTGSVRGATGRPIGALPDYAALVEAAGDFIYTLELDGRFTYLPSPSG